MKNLLIILFLTFNIKNVKCQNYKVVTDSIVWELRDIDNFGDLKCKHEWCYSKEYGTENEFVSCGVNHNGFHCDWDSKIKSRICKICKRKETFIEKWYQHAESEKKSESEKEYEYLNNYLKYN